MKKTSSTFVRPYRILGSLAIVHSASILAVLLVAIAYGHPAWHNSPWWVLWGTLWLVWPAVLALHQGRSLSRFLFTIGLSVLLLLPCVRFYARSAPRVFGLSQMPTPERPLVLSSENLGEGFRRVSMEESVAAGFENVYHGEYLFFGDRKLGHFSSASVSPSRQFAVYIDLASDRLVLFRVADQKAIELTDVPVTDFGRVDWDEPGSRVVLQSSSGLPARYFPLKVEKGF